MALAKWLKSLDGLSDAVKALYIEKDGKFALDLEGDEDVSGLKSALEKERKQRADLEKQMSRFKDVDPERYKELQKKLEELEDEKLSGAGNVDELLKKRTERMRLDFENQIKAMTENLEGIKAEKETLSKRFTEVVTKTEIMNALAEVGTVRKEALPDAIARGLNVWGPDDKGNIVAKKPDGSIIYGKAGTEPLTLKEWAQGLTKEAPHLFMPNQGGGADNRGPVNTGMSADDISKLTPQQKMALARSKQ